MQIKNMFYDDINREINGVIKVDQDTKDTIEQELSEYVITKELKKHFISFFNYYSDSFTKPTADTGVWISGFFGSGKSHFLKILSYILENKEVNGVKTVERFREKLFDDPATFMMIDQSTQSPTETILFNIDIEGSMEKNKTAVLRVFAKMFYKHLGYYGENLKVVKLEQFVARKGKTEEFQRVFEEKHGDSWMDSRDVFDFCGDEIVETLIEVLGMSETSARNWFDSSDEVDISIAQLVSEIKDYVNTKPENYRLIFMIDEVGQYVGADTDMLLNLQSLVEKIGSECLGKVWVMATGQEALDDIIKTRADEFSRIQARFKTRLSLSSSSADEVIQKRILKKDENAKVYLEDVYDKQKNVMDNLFKFREAVGDIRGFEGPDEFSVNFPFVPYQFILMQKVFSEIRKHGNAGKHLSGGERSMLSGFQEATQRIQDRDEYSLVSFWMFYDTVHTFLDGSIRRVVERAERATVNDKGLEPIDINVLKLLYMIRYVDDIPANLDNIVIMMAEDIGLDKISEKEKIQKSLDRLIRQNYIARTGDTYNFLTDAEQDVEREIKDEFVDPSEVTRRISEMIFGSIYTSKKFRYNKKYDFDFNKKVDGMYYGNPVEGMELEIYTTATSLIDKQELRLMAESTNKVLIVLGDTEYYNFIENAMKIDKFARKKNIPQLSKAMQDIIRGKQDDAEHYKEDAISELKEAFNQAGFYIDGDRATINSGGAPAKIDEALEYLVSNVYNKLDLINKNTETDEDIYNILSGKEDNGVMVGFETNRKAASEVETFLIAQNKQHLPTSMADIQKRFTAVPYGWRERDVAAVVARLIYEQKAIIKYGGETIRVEDKRLPELLYKRSEIGKTKIQKREMISSQNIKEAREFLREFFDVMDVPEDDDGLVGFIIAKFENQQEHYDNLLDKYTGKNYPDKGKVIKAKEKLTELLYAQTDNIALVNKLIQMEDELEDLQEDMEAIEDFFKSQVATFDEAEKLESFLRADFDYFQNEDEINDALNKIRLVVRINPKKEHFDYQDLPRLNDDMKVVRDGHNKLLDKKREEILEIVRQCMEEIHKGDKYDPQIGKIIQKSDDFYSQKKSEIAQTKSLRILDGFIPSLWLVKDEAVKNMNSIENSKMKAAEDEKARDEEDIVPKTGIELETQKKKHIKKTYRQALFPAKTLESETEIKEYLKSVEQSLLSLLGDCDGIEIN